MKDLSMLKLLSASALLLTAGAANAQIMRVKMVQHGGLFHAHQRLKYFGPAPFSPIAPSAPMGVQPFMAQPGTASAVNPIDVINLIGLVGRLGHGGGGFGGGNANFSSRVDAVEANVRTLTARVDDLTARIEKLEARVEENRRTRILVEQHDRAIRALWEKNEMKPLPTP